MRITRIKAENIRCIGNVDLELRPFTVLIGPNGAGKSTLLEVIRLFGLLERGASSLTNFFASFGGYSATVPYFDTGPRMKFGIELEGQIDYFVELMPEGVGYYIAREKFHYPKVFGFERKDTDCAYVDANDRPGDLQTPHGPKFAFEESQLLKDEMKTLFEVVKGIFSVRVFRFQPTEPVLVSQIMQPTTIPSEDGDDLFPALWSLRTERPTDYRDLLDAMRVAVPELEEIDFPLAGAGHVNMTWKQSNLKKKLYANQLSHGTLRFLWLLTVLYTVPDGGTVLIDEPELSLHPQWLLLLVSVMRQVSARATVVVATQSSEFVRWVKKNELVVSDQTESGSTFAWADAREDLDKWLEDFTLSELWTMGELGGRR